MNGRLKAQASISLDQKERRRRRGPANAAWLAAWFWAGRQTRRDKSKLRSLRLMRSESRKEVIQPQVPLRLPCYDFTPVADPTVAGCLHCWLAHRLQVKPTPMVWRAVCTRPGNVFTVAFWSTITSNSNFMHSSFREQSGLRLIL